MARATFFRCAFKYTASPTFVCHSKSVTGSWWDSIGLHRWDNIGHVLSSVVWHSLKCYLKMLQGHYLCSTKQQRSPKALQLFLCIAMKLLQCHFECQKSYGFSFTTAHMEHGKEGNGLLCVSVTWKQISAACIGSTLERGDSGEKPPWICYFLFSLHLLSILCITMSYLFSWECIEQGGKIHGLWLIILTLHYFFPFSNLGSTLFHSLGCN